MSFLKKFSKKKVERRASIATITEIPEKQDFETWKKKARFDWLKSDWLAQEPIKTNVRLVTRNFHVEYLKD